MNQDIDQLRRLIAKIDHLDPGCSSCKSGNLIASGLRPPKDSSLATLEVSCMDCGSQTSVLINARKLAKLSRFAEV